MVGGSIGSGVWLGLNLRVDLKHDFSALGLIFSSIKLGGLTCSSESIVRT